MYIMTVCEEPAILNLILFIKSLMEIIGIVVPIILIVMVTLDLVKIVLDSSEKTIKTSFKSMLNRLIAAVVVFFVPMMVNLLMNQVDQGNVESSTCWANANSETIAKYTEVKEAKKLAEQKEKQEKIAENNKKREQEDEERKKNIVKRSGGGTSILETALKEVGNNHSKYTSFYGVAADWCAMFAFWTTAHTSVTGNANDCANVTRSGSDKCYYTSKIDIYSAVVWQYTEWVAKHDRFYHSQYWANRMGTYKDNGRAYEPQPGDFVFFNGGYGGNPLSCRAQLSHIAIVKEVKNGYLYYVGGNQGGSIYYNSSVTIASRPIGDSYIVGYGTWPK